MLLKKLSFSTTRSLSFVLCVSLRTRNFLTTRRFFFSFFFFFFVACFFFFLPYCEIRRLRLMQRAKCSLWTCCFRFSAKAVLRFDKTKSSSIRFLKKKMCGFVSAETLFARQSKSGSFACCFQTDSVLFIESSRCLWKFLLSLLSTFARA
jgi:hypothetical protein